MSGCLHANCSITGSYYDKDTGQYCTDFVCNDCGHTWTICTGGDIEKEDDDE